MTRRLPVLTLLLLAGCGGSAAPGEAAPARDGDSASGGAPTATSDAPPATAAASGLRLVRIGTFRSPLYAVSPPGDRRRVMVVEQGGRVMVVRGGRKLRTPFLDLRRKVKAGGEQGLLSIAFPPDYSRTKRVYAYYTDRQGRQRIVEYRRRTPDRVNHSTARTVLVMDDPEPNHNGGLMLFGPDGLMYIGTGDGGGAGDRHGPQGNAQNLRSLLGKLLRIDPRRTRGARYRVPRTNPFRNRSGARREIYAYGLRNPWRFSFDRRTGDLTIGDVGQNEVEEVNFVRKGRGRGANFGWRVFEGSRRFAEGERAPGHVPPVIEHTHDEGWCSVTGGVVVRDRALRSLYGQYVYGDVCEGRIRARRLAVGQRGKGKPVALPEVEQLVSFGEDARGRVYAVSLSGPVYRLAAR